MDRDTPSLVFDRVQVRRMPGIATGSYELTGLASGINIIHGPNASGKTTTARALESLLWPRAAAPAIADLSGTFQLGPDNWRVEVTGQGASYQMEGRDAEPPLLPPATTRDRYRLSLHELLSSENRDLAAEIVRESAGGYDLAAAAAQLHLRSGATRRGREVAALEDAQARLKDVRAEVAALQRDEERIQELRTALEEAEGAALRVELLRVALEYLRAVEEFDEATNLLSSFPPALAHLRGDEYERLQELRDRLEEAEADRAAAEARRREAEDSVREIGIPPAGVPDGLLDSLHNRVGEVRALQLEIRGHERELAATRTRVAEEMGRIGVVAEESALRQLDLVGLDELATFANSAGAVRSRLQSIEARLSHVQETGSADPADTSRTDRGILLLQQWLRTASTDGQGARRVTTLGATAALLLAGTGGVGLAMGVPTGVAIAIIVIGAILLALVLRTSTSGGGTGLHLQREYERLGLQVPNEWVPDEVSATLDLVETLRARSLLDQEREAERERLTPEYDRLRGEWSELESERAALADRFGLVPELDPAALYLLANRVSRWQDATAELAAASSELEYLRTELRHELGEAAVTLAEFGYIGISDLPSLDTAVGELGRRAEELRVALTEIRYSDDQINRATREIEALEAERIGIFERSGLFGEGAAKAEDLVRELCGRHESYTRAVGQHRDAEVRRLTAHQRLIRAPGYHPDIEERSEAELRAELDLASDRAGRANEIRNEITAIETRIGIAEESHAIEEALAGVERAEADLRALRDRDILGVVGNALVDFLQRTTRDAHRPPVFRRAQRLFTKITRGRYSLDFDDGSEPAFRAVDQETGKGHPLAELSSATHVQLLLAVRIAFIESQEAGAQLPIILDETLGNSDDDRAAAIMDAMIELAAAGRQVFYFTAQPDEVGKWRGALERAEGIEWTIIDLALARQIARHNALPTLPVVAPPDTRTPPPGGMDHDEYGIALLVPGIDIYADIGSTHLWHLTDDPELLYRILELRIESWGALRALEEYGGTSVLGADIDELPRIRAAAHALEATIRAVRIGRGRPVGREQIEASGAVTPVFLDRVIGILDEVDGDAALLIEAIEGGALPRFQANRREMLRDYLEEHGFLDPRDPLSHEECRARVLGEISRELAEGLIDARRVDQFIARTVVGTEAAGAKV